MNSCNNCGVPRCNFGKKFICHKWVPINRTAPLISCVSKVTLPADLHKPNALALFKKHM
jgi:hypothetical protein